MATARIDLENRITPVSRRPEYATRGDGFKRPAMPTSFKAQSGIIELARAQASDHRYIRAGAELLTEGETSKNLYVVLSGWLIQRRTLEDGRRQILDMALPGTVLEYRADGTLPCPLNQKHIGDALGRTSVLGCRTFSRLRHDGLIETGRGRLHILDIKGLCEDAGVTCLGDDDLCLAS